VKRKTGKGMTYYITTAIDYVNSRPHLGTAYEKIAADVIARFHRLAGETVYFLMGNDEHSLKVEQAAREKGLSPLEHCDQMEEVFRDVWGALDIEFDDFIRTTQDRHKAAVSEILNRIQKNGDVFQDDYEGWYCHGCEAFKNEGDVVESKCPDHPNRELAWLTEKNYYFRLSNYQDFLLDLYEKNPDFIQPDVRRNELLELIRGGLENISISRESANWGVPVPFDPEAVVYVWIDALINYVSGTGWPTDNSRFEELWPADLHVIGKDITRFHCVYWPAMLKSAGLPLPKKVFGHGFVNMGKNKMSKSGGKSVDPKELAEHYGTDALRYYLMAEATFGKDLEFGHDRLLVRTNSDLANGLGNLLSRSISMLCKYRDGIIPQVEGESLIAGTITTAVNNYESSMADLKLRQGAEAAMSIVIRANQLVDEEAPWTLAKDPEKAGRLDRVLYDLLEGCRCASVLLAPFMPKKMIALQECLKVDKPLADLRISDAAFGALAAGTQLEKVSPLFPRIEAFEDE
jgi:methionyl-tRNA synthetase